MEGDYFISENEADAVLASFLENSADSNQQGFYFVPFDSAGGRISENRLQCLFVLAVYDCMIAKIDIISSLNKAIFFQPSPFFLFSRGHNKPKSGGRELAALKQYVPAAAGKRSQAWLGMWMKTA